MPLDVSNDSNGHSRAILSEPGGSSLEVLLHGGQVVSWKNDRGEDLLFVRSKSANRSQTAFFGGISICFPQADFIGPFKKQEYSRQIIWSIENDPFNQLSNGSQSSVNLMSKPLNNDPKPESSSSRYELQLSISLGPRKITLIPSVRNSSDKSFSFTFALRNYFSISDISEVRIEGLETLDYLDNTLQKRRFTEHADALTFDGEIHRTYLNTPPKIAVIDHGRKRTFVVNKQGLPDAVVWNPGDKPAGKSFPYLGDDYKSMFSLDSGVIEKPIVLQPFQVWTGFQEVSVVPSSYCSGHLDPGKVVQFIS